MKLFDFINDILYKKNGTLFDKKEKEEEFQPYMMSRWLSMHSNSIVKLLNITTNKLYKALDNNSQWYKLFIVTIPTMKFKRFKYIKKTSKKTKPNTKEDEINNAIKFIAESKQISEREIREYVKDYGLDITTLTKGNNRNGVN